MPDPARNIEDHYRLLVESVTDFAIFMMDGDRRVSSWNEGAERIIGYGAAEIVGRPADVLFTPEDRAAGVPEREQATARATGRATDDRWHLTNDGRRFFASGVMVAIHDDHGAIVGYAKLMRDVTARKLAERALLASEARLAAVVASALDCIVGMDDRGLVTEWNPAAERTFGYARDEAVGREMAELIIPPSLRDRHRAGLAKYLETGDGPVIGRRIEIGAVRRGEGGRDGAEFPVELTITRVAGDGPPRFTGQLRDITDRKRGEAERQGLLERERAARADADRAGHMKDEFLATLGHELRTPLSAILGWSQVLRRGTPKPEAIAEGLATIERNARAQTQIIDDLLDMSRIISGKISIESAPVDLANVVRAAIETVRAAGQAKGIDIRFGESEGEPEGGPEGGNLRRPILGDLNRLQQVFWNLLSNAIKFTPRGGVVAVHIDRHESQWRVDVTDTGEGIAADFVPFVFDRFRQADASTTRRHGGLGLGLSIVKQLVELHGGAVRVRSEGPGQGSRFSVSLPVRALHDDAAPAARPPGDDAGDVAPLSASVREGMPWDATLCDEVRGMSVLIVDDEPDARALLTRLLEACGVTVLVAADADEAIELLARERPDVLVSDIGMPGEDGYGLLRRVRAGTPDRGGGVPAIALTAYARAEDRVSAIRAGFQLHVPKPVEPAELITMIASLRRR